MYHFSSFIIPSRSGLVSEKHFDGHLGVYVVTVRIWLSEELETARR